MCYRSLCSLVCKWSYQADSLGTREWNQDFYKTIGLEDLLNNNATKIGAFSKSRMKHFLFNKMLCKLISTICITHNINCFTKLLLQYQYDPERSPD